MDEAIPSKDDLLERIRRGHAEFDAALAALPAAPAPDGEWSVADHVVHLAAWQEVALARMLDRADDPLIDTIAFGEQGLDEENDEIQRRFAGLDLAAARARLADVNGRLLEALEALPEERLAQPFRSSAPDARLALNVAGNTYEHAEEHLEWIRELVARSGGATATS